MFVKHAGSRWDADKPGCRRSVRFHKGRNTHRSDLYDRPRVSLEEIANSEKPRMPALGCGVMYALSKEYLLDRIICLRQSTGSSSSGVEYLIKRYDIRARYLTSVPTVPHQRRR